MRRIQWYGSARTTPCSTCSCGSRGAWGGVVTEGTVDPSAGSVAATSALALGVGLATVGALSMQPAGAADDEPVTFTVAFLDEVDSFNPFNGYQATSYEMWALMYDYMVGYSMKDMSPAPALATSWETSRGRPDLDLRHPRGRRVVRRGAADRGRHRLHLQPDPRRRSGGRQLGHLPDVRGDRHGSRRHDRRAGALQAERRAAAAADPDPARAHLVRRGRGRGEVLPQRAHRRRGRGRLRPVPARGGHGGRLDVRLGGQPRLLRRRAARRPGGVPGLQERGPRDPGDHQGRGRLRRRHHPHPGRGAAGARRHPRPERRLAVLRGDRLQRRSGRPRERRAAR